MHYESITIPSLQRRGAVLPQSFWPKHIFVKLSFATTHHSHLIFGMWLQSGILHCIYWIQTSRTSTSCLPTLAPKKIFVGLRLPDRPYFNSLPFNILFHLLKIKKNSTIANRPFSDSKLLSDDRFNCRSRKIRFRLNWWYFKLA